MCECACCVRVHSLDTDWFSLFQFVQALQIFFSLLPLHFTSQNPSLSTTVFFSFLFLLLWLTVIIICILTLSQPLYKWLHCWFNRLQTAPDCLCKLRLDAFNLGASKGVAAKSNLNHNLKLTDFFSGRQNVCDFVVVVQLFCNIFTFTNQPNSLIF